MVFHATFNNISVISWRSVLLVEETGVPRENHWPVAGHLQTLSHNVVHLALIEIRTYSGDSRGGYRGGGRTRRTPPKIGKNMIWWRKIVIFHTKYPQKKLSAPPNLKSWIGTDCIGSYKSNHTITITMATNNYILYFIQVSP